MSEAITGIEKQNKLERIFVRIAVVMALSVACIGLLVLLGWALDISLLKSIGRDYITVKANSAISFIMAGVSILMVIGGKAGGIKKYRIGMLLAGLVVLTGVLNVSEYVFRADLGIDQLIFKDPANDLGTVNPGRMAPNSAINFILTGIAILLLDAGDKKIFTLGSICVFITGLISFFALVGYSFGTSEFLGIGTYTRMALYSAVAFFMIFLGIIFARPGRGAMSLISADNPGGILLRYLIPSIIILMFLLAWGTLFGEKRGLFGPNFGTSLFTIVRIVVFISIALLIAMLINKFYEQRIEKEKALQESEARYHDIKEVDRLKSQFIAVISHELRTPLTIIKGFTAYLDKGVAGGLSEKQRDFVGIISHNTERLSHMIGEMTDISRIESGALQIEKQPASLKNIIDDCVRDMGHIASKQGISIISEMRSGDIVMNLDMSRMEQAVINLLNNAVKFSRQGGEVRIVMKHPFNGKLPESIAAKITGDGPFLLLTVSDNGVGVDKKDIAKIFDRFYQAEEHTTRNYQGMGLGLYIAKNIIDAHGGAIWCESGGRDKGASFNIILPVRDTSKTN